ncbi:MAG: efflux RND transporter periplasmic adaptor subunit [Lachnospiraceae bacterium]|nr:efflux RND transporter periplasmic adaptor subunit [Lachnospiraceae bacterium]
MSKKLIAGCVTAIAVCALILPRFMNKQPFAEAVADPVVEVTQPEIRDISLTTGLVGKVEPEDVVYVYPKAPGEVTQVNIKAGEIVEEGQLLCVVDTKQVESAKSSMDSAQLSLKQAQEELSRQSILYASGGISQQAYQQYQDNVTAAQISYNNAKVNYDNQVSYSQITAPISGIIEVCNIEVYDQISQSNLICVISGQGAKIVSFSVTERIKNYLHEGDNIVVEKDSEPYAGQVTEVSFMADSNTGLFKIKARLDENIDESRLPTGSMVKLYVTSERVLDALTIPVDSVYYDGGFPYVYTYDSETSSLHKIQVEVGLYDSDWIEVKSGLDQNTDVLTTWSSELYEGTIVRIKGRT